ncbi:MAG: site-2 protease family protein [Phycisphaeraceae bacterium]|nr:site-2 protease family protein [Phycisphaeraceae bacterium]
MNLGGALSTFLDLLTVMLGFTAIIVVHELGHFLAARWAGIRVLAFAVGFGPALVSWRKGLGFRRGSSDREYHGLSRAERAERNISPTEYRWNLLPLGGYVKMLGQDDADPSARSAEPDGYQSCVPWKRMIVISAGVVMNVILAAALFVIVFSAGLRTEPPRIGEVLPDSPAALAVAEAAESLDLRAAGLQPGDLVVAIDGEAPASFKDIAIAAAMTARGRSLAIDVERPGVDGPLRFNIAPRTDPSTRMMSIGAFPLASNALLLPKSPADRAAVEARLAALGIPGARAGMRLTEVNGAPAPRGVYDAIDAARRSGGSPVQVTFADAQGQARGSIRPTVELSTVQFFRDRERTSRVALETLAGLTPVMRIERLADNVSDPRLRPGDVFAVLGDLEWPNIAEGMAEIRRNGRTSIGVVVWRPADAGGGELIDLGQVPVRDGVIGFGAGTTASTDTRLARFPRLPRAPRADEPPPEPPSGAALPIAPGSRVLAADGAPVSTFADIRHAVLTALQRGSSTVELTVEEPLQNGRPPATGRYTWTLSAADRESLGRLTWICPLGPELFEPEQTILRAATASGGIDVVGALRMGLHETHAVMVQTYLTFARLFQGTVRVEHLKGPVGIAHIGTIIADRGVVWLLFFMAVVSVNLAVINFLPLPIVDGGHFLFLLWEQATGRPVSVAVQNVATLAGLALIGTVFLFVTYNDLVNLVR